MWPEDRNWSYAVWSFNVWDMCFRPFMVESLIRKIVPSFIRGEECDILICIQSLSPHRTLSCHTVCLSIQQNIQTCKWVLSLFNRKYSQWGSGFCTGCSACCNRTFRAVSHLPPVFPIWCMIPYWYKCIGRYRLNVVCLIIIYATPPMFTPIRMIAYRRVGHWYSAAEFPVNVSTFWISMLLCLT